MQINVTELRAQRAVDEAQPLSEERLSAGTALSLIAICSIVLWSGIWLAVLVCIRAIP